jgi:16S rRNA A1518/A1519 N6-dimethyltransferase RsmA/KsgA/DIM1 with predicted DNA glycosylase/AP lyase activity
MKVDSSMEDLKNTPEEWRKNLKQYLKICFQTRNKASHKI